MFAGQGEDQGVPVPGSEGKRVQMTRSIVFKESIRKKSLYKLVQ